MRIVGSPFLQDAQILQLSITNCVNSTANANGCADPLVRDAFISSITAIFDYVQIDLFLVDALITPTQPNPVIRVIKADQFITFGLTFGTRGTLQLLPYHI
jgi:hypothetical protein